MLDAALLESRLRLDDKIGWLLLVLSDQSTVELGMRANGGLGGHRGRLGVLASCLA